MADPFRGSGSHTAQPVSSPPHATGATDGAELGMGLENLESVSEVVGFKNVVIVDPENEFGFDLLDCTQAGVGEPEICFPDDAGIFKIGQAFLIGRPCARVVDD